MNSILALSLLLISDASNASCEEEIFSHNPTFSFEAEHNEIEIGSIDEPIIFQIVNSGDFDELVIISAIITTEIGHDKHIVSSEIFLPANSSNEISGKIRLSDAISESPHNTSSTAVLLLQTKRNGQYVVTDISYVFFHKQGKWHIYNNTVKHTKYNDGAISTTALRDRDQAIRAVGRWDGYAARSNNDNFDEGEPDSDSLRSSTNQ